ncbi:hypothetical protein ACHFCA_34975 (plasmid) [Delftia tsuruhatensis]
MGIRQKEDCRAETQRKFGLWIGFFAGATSAWIVYGIYTSWALFKVAPWWEVLAAVGAMLAAFGSVYAAYTAVTISVRNREEAKRDARDEATSYVISRMYVFKKAIKLFNAAEMHRNQEKLEVLFPDHLDQLYEMLRSLDMHKLYLVHPGFRKRTVAVLAGLDMLVEKVDEGYVSREEKLSPLTTIISWSLQNMYNAAFDLYANRDGWEEHLGREFA